MEHVRELEEARKRLKHQAEHDDLTGVANRSKLTSYLQELVASADKEGHGIGLIHFDLDHFKEINDSHGHSAGDAVLRHSAEVLTSVVGKDGLVARIGGDEFVAILPAPGGRNDMEDVGNRILGALEKPVKVEHQNLRVAGSVGLVLADASKTSVAELVNRADIALYEAKKNGRGQVAWYTDALGSAHRHRRMTMARLDQDLETGNLSLMMEPQYCLNSKTITGYEVHAMWLHPSEGLVDPVRFLSSYEDQKRIAGVERFALKRGLAEIRRLRDMSNTPYTVAVNLTDVGLKGPRSTGRA